MMADEVNRTNLDIVIHNFKEIASRSRNAIDDFAQRSVRESLGDSAGVDSTHSIIRPIVRIALHGTLHGNTTVEYDVHESRDSQNISD